MTRRDKSYQRRNQKLAAWQQSGVTASGMQQTAFPAHFAYGTWAQKLKSRASKTAGRAASKGAGGGESGHGIRQSRRRVYWRIMARRNRRQRQKSAYQARCADQLATNAHQKKGAALWRHRKLSQQYHQQRKAKEKESEKKRARKHLERKRKHAGIVIGHCAANRLYVSAVMAC
jgi:hypothetical protein